MADKDSNAGASNAGDTSHNTTKARNRTTSRKRPLHIASLSSNGDDEEVDKENNNEASKIKSRCEQDTEEK